MKHMITIEPNGETTVISATKVSLEMLQHAVGGYIESIPHLVKYDGKRCIAYANEHGRTLEYNEKATNLWKENLAGKASLWYDPKIRGNLVIVTEAPKVKS